MERILTVEVSDCTGLNSGQTNVNDILRIHLGLTKNQISQAKFRGNGICRNGKCCRISDKVEPGDRITIKLEEVDTASNQLIPREGKLHILYEDTDLILVSKPAGVVVHPSPGHYKDTLANMLAYYFQQQKQQVLIRPIGRLDRDTSGIVVFAKNQTAAARLEQQKKQGIFYKEYTAIVHGCMEQSQGEIHTPIGSVPGKLNKMQVCSEEGKPAHTSYVVEQTGIVPQNKIHIAYKDAECLQNAEKYSVLRVTIHTGRTHQIRVHMASIGHPLLGDTIYNPQPAADIIGRMALHAGKVCLRQPFTGERIVAEDMAAVENMLAQIYGRAEK